jgi:Zn-dependent protease with chaperone function
MAEQFPGQFYDGHSAGTQAVRVTPAPHGVAFQLDDGTQYWWPFEETTARRSAVSLTFEHGQPLAQSLVMDHPAFIAAMESLNPQIAGGQRPSNHDLLWKLGALAAVCIGFIVALVVWGFPWAVSVMASLMPVSVEKKIGAAVVDSLAPKSKRCSDPSVNRIVSLLSEGAPRHPYEFQVYVIEDPTVNAFAAPGGYIAIYRGLLNKTRRPEEAAAVLAHEMQHIIQRHSVRGMMRGLSIWVALALITGNAGDTLINLAGTLGSLHYQRADETEADVEGLQVLENARIDTKAMVSMLQLLDSIQGDAPAAAKYFSTHPLTGERIERIRDLAADSRGTSRPLLAGMPWPPDRIACEAR